MYYIHLDKKVASLNILYVSECITEFMVEDGILRVK